jgi:hypothetical protein
MPPDHRQIPVSAIRGVEERLGATLEGEVDFSATARAVRH